MKKFIVKLTQWEYWPFSVLYFPVFFYYFWLVLKKRSFFFFSAANPSIEFGGMFGERKSDIFRIIPKEYVPETYLIQKGDVLSALEKASNIDYPLIAKPNVGERGTWVKKIEDPEELSGYAELCPVDFLLQELVDLPIELGVFYVRMPSQEKGRVTSIVRKHFLTVVGDGKQSVFELLGQNIRAVMTADFESDYLKEVGSSIPEQGEEVMVEPIGNHCRGTQFLNDNDQISEKLSGAMDVLAKQIPDFYFGRFDIRCQSYEDLERLKHFKILELNGAGSEPGHIYQPGYSLTKAYKDILWHLGALADISEENKAKGVPFVSFKEGIQKWKAHRAYNKLLNA